MAVSAGVAGAIDGASGEVVACSVSTRLVAVTTGTDGASWAASAGAGGGVVMGAGEALHAVAIRSKVMSGMLRSRRRWCKVPPPHTGQFREELTRF